MQVQGFAQARDFFAPNEFNFNPSVVIEAKLTEDDGTARDKVTRVQHLEAVNMQRQRDGKPSFEVVACIAGRGFEVRREDMKKLLRATRGKVFTLQNMQQVVGDTRLAGFRTLFPARPQQAGGSMRQPQEIREEVLQAMPSVCSRCINEPFLGKYIEENASEYECSYCGEEWECPRAMDLDELLAHVRERIETEYEDAANSVGYETREGGYLLPTMNAYDLLSVACPDWDLRSERLGDDIAAEFIETPWVHKNPYSPTDEQVWIWSWTDFVHLVKHRVRYLLFPPEMQSGDEFSETTAPSEMLDRLGNLFRDQTLFCELEAGTELFRVRIHDRGHPPPSTLDEFGPPPVDAARFANRMSPAGVSMFYAALDEETALAETYSPCDRGPAEASIGVFKTLQDLYLLDFVDLPEVPSIFAEDAANRDRDALGFLHAFNLDLTCPVEKDGREHVEYVPSQAVTEFVRYRLPGKLGRAVHGIRYRSSRRSGGVGCVLFYAHEDIVDGSGLGPADTLPFELVSVRTRTAAVDAGQDR